MNRRRTPRCSSPSRQQRQQQQKLPAPSPRLKLSPLPASARSLDERCEREDHENRAFALDDPIAAAITAVAARSPPKKYARLQTLASLAEQQIVSMHNGDFVARSRLRFQQHPSDVSLESDAARAHRISRESAALVVQSAWRRAAAVRLRVRLMNRIWQQQMDLAATLSRGRDSLQALLEVLHSAASRRPLVLVARQLDGSHNTSRLTTLTGAYYHLPVILLSTWLRFSLSIQQKSRFLRRPAPAILHAVHIPVRNMCRLLARVWRQLTQLALAAIQCRARAYLARCKYWTLLATHRKHQAAILVQALYRAWVARRLVWRLRRRRAALRIQCAWRCCRARRRVVKQRIFLCASQFLTDVTTHAVQAAADFIIDRAVRHIQRVYRGQCARARFLVLVMQRKIRQWYRNPSKGYALFENGQYPQAAVYLERCFRQGIFQDEPQRQPVDDTETDANAGRGDHLARGRQQLDMIQSRHLFSFSETPASLTERLRTHTQPHDRRPATAPANATVNVNGTHSTAAAQLRFWQTYALSHWFAFQANGDPLHLSQARVGFETLLRLHDQPPLASTTSTSTGCDAERQFMRLHARYCLVLCVYWSSEKRHQQQQDTDLPHVQALCIEVLDELEVLAGLTTAAMIQQATQWRTQLTMVSAALYFVEKEFDACYAQLETLLKDQARGKEGDRTYDEEELHVLMAVMLLQKPPEASLRHRAESHLKKCFQMVELWRGVGFYHGYVSSSAAAEILAGEPVGAFLLHHEVASSKMLLKVKLSSEPCKVSSLRIHYEDDVYSMKKLPNCTHFSVHGLVQQLPKAAGIQFDKGVRRSLHVASLTAKLQASSTTTTGHAGRLSSLLDWDQWLQRVAESKTHRNEVWSALSQVAAVRLEASEAHAMAAVVARDGLATARDRVIRAELFFTVGRAMAHTQQRGDAALAFQQAAMESARLKPRFNQNFVAIRRALSRGVGVEAAQRESFASQLDRVGKLERMSVQAWSYDSYSPGLRGAPFCEALLLQRIDDEVSAMAESTHSVADTFFLRSLLRAHMKAFLRNGSSSSSNSGGSGSGGDDRQHVALALRCVHQLFDKFRVAETVVTSANHSDAGAAAVMAACARHLGLSYPAMSPPSSSSRKPPLFTLHALLLTWHRMPFQVAYEMAEVLYRSPCVDCNALIDVYESLYGRVRSQKPRTGAYAAYEELFLVRLAFLYAQKSTTSGDARSLKKAVDVMDELIVLRKLRALLRGGNTVQRIHWPSASTVRFPIQFSLAELAFIRGFFWERLAVTTTSTAANHPDAQANAWRDYDELHHELLSAVVSEQERQRENNIHSTNRATSTMKLQGIRVFIGDTKDVEIANILHSKPYVVVQCEGKQSPTQEAATWMNQLSPAWHEHVEIDVASSTKARLIKVVVLNRSTRRSQVLDGDQVLGYVQIFIEELLLSAMDGGHQEPKMYDLVCRKEPSSPAMRPQIRLGFQVIAMTTNGSQPNKASVKQRRQAHRHGHWDLDELQTNLHGDVRRFVASAWIWRWFGRQWLADKDFSIAAWFLQRAIDQHTSTMSSSSSKLQEAAAHERVAYAADLADLATCYRATMGGTAASSVYARPLLEQAMGILQTEYEASGSTDLALWKQWSAVAKMAEAVAGDAMLSPSSPLAVELAKKIPASSHWIAMRSARGDDGGHCGCYYFNEDTGERFQGVESEPNVHTPLEWEYNGDITVAAYRDPLRPRRVVVLSSEMKARVARHCEQQQRLHAQDPLEWVAVFNARKQVMQFLSVATQEGVLMTTKQPVAYVMLADESTVYHVLVVQDAYRKFQQRRKRQRRLRGLLRSACVLVYEWLAARNQLAERAEENRKRALNCLHVVIEKASKLRAMDLLTSDPFVEMELVDGDGDVVAKGKTSVRRHTVNPQWNEEFRLHYAFTDHVRRRQAREKEQAQEAAESAAVLRLEVYDYDAVAAFRQDEDHDDAGSALAGDDKPKTATVVAAYKTKPTKYDFLGLAVVPVEPLVHGKCLTADLVLRDRDGYDSPRSRGQLTVTLQWVHDASHNTTKWRRNALTPKIVVVEPLKRVEPKPEWRVEWTSEWEAARQASVAVLAAVSELAVVVEQLVRLYKRWKHAQKSGKTAEEAKLLEQRLQATLAPFHVQKRALFMHVQAARDVMVRLCEIIKAPVDEYITCCELEQAEKHAHTFEKAVASITSGSGGGGQAGSDIIEHFLVSITELMTLPQTVGLWRQAMQEMVATFFTPVQLPVWESEGERNATKQLDKIRVVLAETTAATPSGTVVSAAPSIGSIASMGSNTGTNSGVVLPASATSSVAPTPNAAMAKRLERIEREKNKKAKRNKKG